MTGDRQVRFYERRGVRFPPATHPISRPDSPARIPREISSRSSIVNSTPRTCVTSGLKILAHVTH